MHCPNCHCPGAETAGVPHAQCQAASDLLAACEEAIASLSWDGVPHLNPGEMQHRANLAIYGLRAAIAKAKGK